MTKATIEIFLFVDPLGKRCNNVRKTIKEFQNDYNEQVKLRIIPVVNFKKVYGYTRKNSKGNHDSFVELNNYFSTNTYKAALAFHASAMQGKNKAHRFLSILQEIVVEKEVPFSEDLIYQIAKEINIDKEMFREDYQSDLVKRIYQQNLRLASKMKVIGTPSCVIYKNGDDDQAIRLNKEFEYNVLQSICGCTTKNEAVNQKAVELEKGIQEAAQHIAQLNIL